jgi:hypothetical protein
MKHRTILYFTLIIFILPILSCGDNRSASPYGGLSVQILWPNSAGTSSASRISKAAPAGLVTMRFSVTGTGMTTMQQDFSASAGSGVISGVPVGTGRTLTIQGLDASSAVTYHASVSNITVSSGQTAQCGAVTMVAVSAFTGANFKMPDTNQAIKYTTTFGEDADYTINPPSYTDHGNGTVTDNVTTLLWQQSYGGPMNWDDASAYCADLAFAGYSDWRLPSRMELVSLVDLGTYHPAINTTYFPGMSSESCWSSTTWAYSTSDAYTVFFDNGFTGAYNKTNNYYVRCVRGGQ